MIEGLDPAAEPGLSDLGRVLRAVLGESDEELLFAGWERLKPRVYRVRFATANDIRSLVIKQLDPLQAMRSERVAKQWLPAVDLASGGPGLLGVAASAGGQWVWHVYEDHGDFELRGHETNPLRVAAAVRLIARIHSRFASHPLLAECRQYGSFDISWFASNLRDAVRSLEALRRSELAPSPEHAALRDRLLARLRRLLEDEPRRARALAEWGGPETLLHGDLWTSNVFVVKTAHGLEARLTDWDRAGVGPISYDLSTFLLRFPAEQRAWILDLYVRSLEPGVWRPPAPEHLNLLCETAELSRYANRVVWPALAIARERAAWGYEELAEVERWFEAFEPVLVPVRAPRTPGREAAGGARW